MSKHDMQGNDYVSLSKFRMEGVHDWQSDEGMTDATLICTALDAQTQATLALAYEQRTALLMAYASAIDNTDAAVHAQIKERLNLA